MSRTAEQVEDATSAPPRTPGPTEVVVKGPSLSERLFGTTQSIVTVAIEVFILLYFLLAAGDLFLQKLIKVLPQLKDKKRAVTIARETEAGVSAYLFTMTLLNIGEGVVVAVAMALLGVPNAVLWGVLAVVLEYVPYVGAFVLAGILALVGLSTFDDPLRALLVPGVYVAINFIQGNFLVPMVLGRAADAESGGHLHRVGILLVDLGRAPARFWRCRSSRRSRSSAITSRRCSRSESFWGSDERRVSSDESTSRRARSARCATAWTSLACDCIAAADGRRRAGFAPCVLALSRGRGVTLGNHVFLPRPCGRCRSR